MKIAIIGSMKFAEDMVKIKEQLDELGHDAKFPLGLESHLQDGQFVDNLDDNLEWCITHDIMRKNFKQVANSDAVLVLNYKRNDIDGYIGISALMEMGVAHYLKKKIFLLNHTPDYKNARWAHEVAIMQPKIIKGDLTKII
jgi:nucleoside 2-deoxyribosyltransferase